MYFSKFQHLHKLRCTAAQRGVTLRFLPPNFTRHKHNTTYLDWKTKKIDWKVEWKFVWKDVTTVENRYSNQFSCINSIPTVDILHLEFPKMSFFGMFSRKP